MSTAKKTKINTNVKKLNELIKHFEESGDNLDLESDLGKYEEAMQLVSEVKKELESFELKINEIKDKYQNAEETEPEDMQLL